MVVRVTRAMHRKTSGVLGCSESAQGLPGDPLSTQEKALSWSDSDLSCCSFPGVSSRSPRGLLEPVLKTSLGRGSFGPEAEPKPALASSQVSAPHLSLRTLPWAWTAT